MTKRIYKRMPKEFLERVKREVEKMEREELDELIAKGQRIRERIDRLNDASRAKGRSAP